MVGATDEAGRLHVLAQEQDLVGAPLLQEVLKAARAAAGAGRLPAAAPWEAALLVARLTSDVTARVEAIQNLLPAVSEARRRQILDAEKELVTPDLLRILLSQARTVV